MTTDTRISSALLSHFFQLNSSLDGQGHLRAMHISQKSLTSSEQLAFSYDGGMKEDRICTSAVFPFSAFTLLIFLLQKLKEEIAQVFAEIEGFQNAEERQEADQNPGERTR